MNKKQLMVISVVGVLLLSGCASTESINFYKDGLKYSATNPKDVKVFHKLPTDREFIELGEVTVEAYGWSEVEKLLKARASKAGGDAVYILNKDEKREGAMIGQIAAMDTRLIVTGVVIKYETK